MNTHPVSPALRLIVTARQLETLQAARLEFLGIGPGQLQAIIVIIASPGICQADVARRLKMDKSTANRIVNKLLRAKLVEKIQSRTDRRIQGLIPTNLAKVSQKFYLQEVPDLDEIITYGFSPPEKKQFNDLLSRASATIQHVLDLPPNEVFPPLFEPWIPSS